ncbi:MAG: LysR family transcriptional regulator [Coriobacteriales bacterium]|nr:LysR family transcriptional regulator [Coriobacteriales bacterium]
MYILLYNVNCYNNSCITLANNYRKNRIEKQGVMMNLWAFEQYCEVVKTQSFTRAAHNLNISLPTLSRNISQLEKELKVKLLVREKTNTLTPAGKVVFRYAAQHLDLHKEMLGELSQLKYAGESTILIQDLSVMPQLANILRNVIATMHMTHSQLNIRMKAFHGKSLEDSLLDKTLDIIFLFRLYCDNEGSAIFKDKRVASMKLEPYDNPLIVGLPKNYPLTTKGTISCQKFNQLMFARAADIAMDHYFASFWRALDQRGISPHYSMIAIENDLTELYLSNTKNLAITASKSLVDYKLLPSTAQTNVTFVNISDLDTRQHLYVLWRKNDENVGVKLFIKRLEAVFAALAKDPHE